MDGTFACPECGCEIEPAGLSPGRQVRCDFCRTWVEVPFIPRAGPIKRMRRDRASRKHQRAVWAVAWIVIAAAFLVVGVAGARQVVRSRWRSADAVTLERLLESSRSAESQHRLGEALSALEAALALGARCDPKTCNLEELRRHRKELALREAEEELAKLEGDPSGSRVDTGQRVGRALTLRARVETDAALAGLLERVDTAVQRLRIAQVEADASDALEAEQEEIPDRAMELVVRIHRTAEDLPSSLRVRWQRDAAAIATRLISKYGLIAEPLRAHFTLGSAASYDSAIQPVLGHALREAHYLVRPKSPLWEDTWAKLAPFRLTMEVTERQEGAYLGSPNRLSLIDARLGLWREKEQIWHIEPHAVTTVPLPGLAAYQASRLAVGSHRNPELEHMLYDNARSNLAERLSTALRSLPSSRPDRSEVPEDR
jgi:hypothetical protein